MYAEPYDVFRASLRGLTPRALWIPDIHEDKKNAGTKPALSY